MRKTLVRACSAALVAATLAVPAAAAAESAPTMSPEAQMSPIPDPPEPLPDLRLPVGAMGSVGSSSPGELGTGNQTFCKDTGAKVALFKALWEERRKAYEDEVAKLKADPSNADTYRRIARLITNRANAFRVEYTNANTANYQCLLAASFGLSGSSSR